jgi:hypothetical protein
MACIWLSFLICSVVTLADPQSVAGAPVAEHLLIPTTVIAEVPAVDPGVQGRNTQASGRRAWNGLTEFKREWTDKGDPPEKTQSTIKVDWYPRLTSAVSLLRLQLVFPDENQNDATVFNFFHPRVGDLKTRIGFRSFSFLGTRLAVYEEITFPTADPPDLGQEKYQLNTGARTSTPVTSMFRFDVQISETLSVAGDPSAKAINKTNAEVTGRRTWRAGSYVQLSLKPVVD